VIGPGVAGGGRRHVAQDHVGRAAEGLAQKAGGILGQEVVAQNGGPRDRLHLLDVDGDDPAALPALSAGGGAGHPHPLHGDLGPAARGRAQVDDALAGGKEMKPVVELDELEGGPRAVAALARLGDVGVAQLALEPTDRRGLAPLGRLDPGGEPAPAGPAPAP
jgi:hypothetical protein